MPVSLSVRLALGYALTLGLLLSAFAAFSFVATRQAGERSFERHLAHEWSAVAPLVRAGPDGLDVAALDAGAPYATRVDGAGATYARLLDADGRVRWASANLRGRAAPAVRLPATPAAATYGQTWDGAGVRTLVAPLASPPPGAHGSDGHGSDAHGSDAQDPAAHAGHAAALDAARAGAVWLEVSGAEWAQTAEARGLAVRLALGVVFGLLVALGAGWALARRALRPVAVLTHAAERAARAGQTGARLPAQFTHRDELTDLAETFNGLLARLEAAAARERRFTADAAHELLTPIATLRSDAEVALRRERTPDAYREVLARVVAEAAAMASTVRGLLTLARAEAPQPPGRARLDLGALVAERVARFQPVAEARGVTLAAEADAGVTVAAEGAPLADVVDNLVANALTYTPAGGRVSVRLAHADATGRCAGAATLTVADTGIGFSAADGERLFERFFRADAPGVQAEPGSGLGLAIARAVVEGAGGTLAGESPGPGRGATFRVTLPCLGHDA